VSLERGQIGRADFEPDILHNPIVEKICGGLSMGKRSSR